MRTLLTALAGIAVIAALAVPSGALAAPPAITGEPNSSRAAASACPITVAGYRGAYICGTHTDQVYYSSGSVLRRVFVIGTDHAVWNIAEYRGGGTSGWISLGGWAQIGVWIDYYYSTNPYRLGISVWGAGSYPDPWCRDLNYSWGPWWRCG